MTEKVLVLPPGYRRIRTLKPVEYAREIYPPGRTLVVDRETAERWVRAKLVEAAPEPEVAMTRTSCPKCGSAMEYAAEPVPEARWTQCRNAACGHGWMR